MKNIIIVAEAGRESMKKVFSKTTSDCVLAIRMRNKVTKKEFWRVYENKSNLKKYSDYDDLTAVNSRIIRFGTQANVVTNSATICYNIPSALENASNKITARKLLIDKKIQCPITWYDIKSVNKYPVIMRPEKHKGGNELIFIRDYQELISAFNKRNKENKYYFSEFIDKSNEYRVHVASGKVISVLEKPKPKDGSIAWNVAAQSDAEDWKVIPRNNCDRRLMNYAIESVRATGLDYGSVDIIALRNEEKKTTFFVLEVNTSPDLRTTEYNSGKFAKIFDMYFTSNVKIPFENDITSESLRNDYFWKI